MNIDRVLTIIIVHRDDPERYQTVARFADARWRLDNYFSSRGRIVESRKTSIAVEDHFKVVPFAEFCEIAHVGHSTGYEFLNSGDVKSVLVGRRRLVLIQSWYDYLERLLADRRNCMTAVAIPEISPLS